MVTVKVAGVLATPTPTSPKAKLLGVTWIAAGNAPVPLKATVAGAENEPELTVRMPVAAPDAVGAKLTPTVQLDAALRLPWQVNGVTVKPEVAVKVSVLAA